MHRLISPQAATSMFSFLLNTVHASFYINASYQKSVFIGGGGLLKYAVAT